MYDLIMTLRQINLYTIHGDLRTETLINVVQILLVDILIESDFLVNYTTIIYPRKRKLNPLGPKPINILPTGALNKLTLATASS